LKTGIFILGIIVIAVAVFFTLNKQEKSNSESVEVELANGESIQLTKEEVSLIPNKDEKKVILTDLGMT
jgi:preprotein translocase subunit YajC